MGKTWINHNGVWKESYPKVNHNGIWKPSKPWVNHYGVWKKAFGEGIILCAASDDDTVRRINPETGQEIWTFTQHVGDANYVTIDPNGYIYSASDDDTICKIDLNGNLIWQVNYGFYNVDCVIYDDNRNVLYAGFENSNLCKINSYNGNIIWTNSDHSRPVKDIVYDSYGNIYTVSRDDTVRKFDTYGNLIWTYTGHNEDCYRIAIDPYGYVYSASLDDSVSKLDSNGTLIWKRRYRDNCNCVEFNPIDGNIYIGLYEWIIYKVNRNNGDIISTYTQQNDILDIAIDSDGYIYASSESPRLIRKLDMNFNKIWDFTGFAAAIRGISVKTI